jgi:hypothetical protein
LHEVRYRAMEVVRQFIREQPIGAGLIVAGRAHFFDSERERKNALHPASNFVELTLNEFNDEQIQRYLTKRGLSGSVPGWMPSRPLLVGYLAASGVLKEAFSDANGNNQNLAADPAKGWDYILDRVCEREADIEAGIDGTTVRRILERLATLARHSQSGLGPLSPEDIADVCRVGDLLAYISHPFADTLELFRGSDRGIGILGIGLVHVKAEQVGLSSGRMVPAIERAVKLDEFSSLVLDLVRVSIECGVAINTPIQLKDVLVPFLELSADMTDFSKLTFRECLFSHLALDHGVPSANLPKFLDCYIDVLDGRLSVNDLPLGVFDKACEFGRFHGPSTGC